MIQTFEEYVQKCGRAKFSKSASARAKQILSLSKIKQLYFWCKRHHITVVFEQPSSVEWGIFLFSEKKIVINATLVPCKAFVVMCHEIGHALHNNSLVKKPINRWKFGYNAIGTTKHVQKTSAHKLAILDSEIEAWWLGEKLACDLNIVYDKNYFDKIKFECIKSYIKSFILK